MKFKRKKMNSPKRRKQSASIWNKYDSLFLEHVNDSDPVISGERVWAPGAQLYRSVMEKKWNNTEFTPEEIALLDQSIAVSPNDEAVLAEVARFSTKKHAEIQPKQVFWLEVLESTTQKLWRSTRFDATESAPSIWIIFCGLRFLLLYNPEEAEEFCKASLDDFNEFLRGDEYWEHNPLLAVPIIVWFTKTLDTIAYILPDLVPTISNVVDKFKYFPLEPIREQDVSEQVFAISLVENVQLLSGENIGSLGTVGTVGTSAFAQLAFFF